MFNKLLDGLTDNAQLIAAFNTLIADKAKLGEAEVILVDPVCLEYVVQVFQGFADSDMDGLDPKQQSLHSDDLRHLLEQL